MIFDNLYTVKSTALIDRTFYDLNRINLISIFVSKNMFWIIERVSKWNLIDLGHWRCCLS